jgi:hypothetical protein
MTYWIVNLIFAVVAFVFSVLGLRNYINIKKTQVGRYMLAIASALTVASLITVVAFVFWWIFRGHGPDVALPALVISASLAASSIALYRLSSM